MVVYTSHRSTYLWMNASRHNTWECHTNSWEQAQALINSVIKVCGNECSDVLPWCATLSDTRIQTDHKSQMGMLQDKDAQLRSNYIFVVHTYSKVCRRVKGYLHPWNPRCHLITLDSTYVDEVMLDIPGWGQSCRDWPSLNVSTTTAVPVWSTVDKDQDWTADSIGHPEVANKATGADPSYVLAWAYSSCCVLKGTWMKVST